MLIALLGIALPCAFVQAQSTINNNNYSIDVFTGPVLGPGRLIGMGGANTALANGIDGVRWNPAAYSARAPWDLDWFTWDLTLNLTLQTPLSNNSNDFDNDGRTNSLYKNFTAFDVGGLMQFGNLGLGAMVSAQNFRLNTESIPFDVQLTTTRIGGSYDFMDGQLGLGGGIRLATLSVNQVAPSRDLVSFQGSGLELGGAIKIADQPWRLGFAFSDAVTSKPNKLNGVTTDADGVRRVDQFVLPTEVHVPWELRVGFAFQFGNRPLNGRWVNPHDEEERLRRELAYRQERRMQVQLNAEKNMGSTMASGKPYTFPISVIWWNQERERRAHEARVLEDQIEELGLTRIREIEQLSRNYLLTSVDVGLAGPTVNGVGLEGFLAQENRVAGRDTTWGLRAGLETEPWAHHMKVRAGSYLEPSRFDVNRYRVHGTLGVDFNLLHWDVFGLISKTDWRITATSDIAERYFQWGVGIGVWH